MWEVAQGASPLVAVLSWVVTVVLYRQTQFERAEHRKAEESYTASVVKMAVAMERIAGAMRRQGTSKSRGR